MTTPDWSPPGIDTARPSVARVYDYYLGGFHNFPADREMSQAVIAAYPLATAGVRAGREFMARAVTHLAADLGVRQFLDLGSGIPTQRNVHEVAQAVDPAAPRRLRRHRRGRRRPRRGPAGRRAAGGRRHGRSAPPRRGAPLPRGRPVAGPVAAHRGADDVGAAVRRGRRPAGRRGPPAPGRVRRGRGGGGNGRSSWIALSHTTRGLVLVDQWRPARIADVEHPGRFAGWAGVARARE